MPLKNISFSICDPISDAFNTLNDTCCDDIVSEDYLRNDLGDKLSFSNRQGALQLDFRGRSGKNDLRCSLPFKRRGVPNPKNLRSYPQIQRRNEILGSVKKVIYIDVPDSWYPDTEEAGTINSAVDAGYNVIILAFWMSSAPQLASGACDTCAMWERDISTSLQQSTIDYAHSKGAIVLASAGGAVDVPWDNLSGEDYGSNVAKWALANNLDGVDFDIENFSQGFIMYTGSSDLDAIGYLSDMTQAARDVLGPNGYITHAPQAPYFGPINPDDSSEWWTGSLGGYSQVYKDNHEDIDWFNIQFYNQGTTMYVDYNGLFIESGGSFPGTSVQEIVSYGIPQDKIVIGKYMRQDIDGSDGYVDPTDLNIYLAKANVSFGFIPSVMVWQYPGLTEWPKSEGGGPTAAKDWIDKVESGLTTSARKKRAAKKKAKKQAANTKKANSK